jgi:hypothetical protein
MVVVDTSLLDARVMRTRARVDRIGQLLEALDRPDVRGVLQAGDRMLLELSLGLGHSDAFVAKYLAWPRSRVRRRLTHFRRAIARPEVRWALDLDSPMSDACRKVALRCLLVGDSVALVSKQMRMCPRSVRGHLAYLRGWCSATHYLARRLAEVQRQTHEEQDR